MRDLDLTVALPYLRHFHAIGQHKNLRKAAEALHLSPSAVTQALKQLEDLLGLTLCVRSRREFQLTPEGGHLLEVTTSAFQELSQFSASINRKKKTGGHLCLGVIDGFSNSRYQSTINSLVRKFPEAYLSIMVFPSEEIVRRVSSGELDGGFGIFSERNQNLSYHKIGEERLTYFISNRHSLNEQQIISKESVRGQKSVWIDNESKTKIEIERDIFIERPHQSLKIQAFTNNEGVATQLLKTGKYVVPLPDTFSSSPSFQGCREVKISKGPRVLNQEFVYNPKTMGNALRSFVVEELERTKT